MGRGNCKILQNGVFQSSKQCGVPKLYTKEKLDICNLMATDRSYTERYQSEWSTIVTKSWKYFWFGPATEWESHKCYQASVELGFCSILPVEKFFNNMLFTGWISLIWTVPKCTITKGVRITEDVLYTDVNVHINTNTIQCTQVIFPVGFVHHTVLPCFQLGINVQPLHYLWCQ